MGVVVAMRGLIAEVDDGGRPETRLDDEGLVLLQKAVSGARPSRWIAPALMDAALAHLDAVGTGPTARPLMLERGTALESLGFTRHAGLRRLGVDLLHEALQLSDPADLATPKKR